MAASKESKKDQTSDPKTKAAPAKAPVPRNRKSLLPTDPNQPPAKAARKKPAAASARLPTPPDSVGERTPTKRAQATVQMFVDRQLKEEIEGTPSKRRKIIEGPSPMTPMTRGRMIAVAV